MLHAVIDVLFTKIPGEAVFACAGDHAIFMITLCIILAWVWIARIDVDGAIVTPEAIDTLAAKSTDLVYAGAAILARLVGALVDVCLTIVTLVPRRTVTDISILKEATKAAVLTWVRDTWAEVLTVRFGGIARILGGLVTLIGVRLRHIRHRKIRRPYIRGRVRRFAAASSARGQHSQDQNPNSRRSHDRLPKIVQSHSLWRTA